MVVAKHKPLGQLLRRLPRYGINAAAVPLAPGVATYIRITDIDDSGRFSPNPKVGVAHASAGSYRLAPGELVFARTGASVGKSYLYDSCDGELVYAGFLINIAPDPKLLNPKYLSLFVQSKDYWDWVARTSVRSGQPGINGREYAQLLVPLPDIATQEAIAEVAIDVDNLIATLERIIAKKKAIKQGMVQRLLTDKTHLSGWPCSRLSDLIDGLEAGVSVRSFEHASHGVAVLKTSAVSGGRFDPTEAKSVLPADLSRVRRNPVAGSLIISRMNTPALVGEVGYVEQDYSNLYLPDRLWLACPKGGGRQTVNMRWLGYYLSSESGSRAIRELATGTSGSMKNISKVRLLALEIPTPPLFEQNRIAEALHDVDCAIELLRDRLSKARDVKHGIMQQLLTGRTRIPIKDGVA